MVPFLAAYMVIPLQSVLRWLRALSVPGLEQLWCGLLWCTDRRDYRRHRVHYLKKIPVHKVLRSVMPILLFLSSAH